MRYSALFIGRGVQKEHRVFAVEEFMCNNESVVAVKRVFRRHFNIPPRGSVPKRNTISSWVHIF